MLKQKPYKNNSDLSICLLTLAWPGQANPSHGHFIEKQTRALRELGHPVIVVAPRTYLVDPIFTKDRGIEVYRFPYLSGNKRFSDYSQIPISTILTFFLSGLWHAFKLAKRKGCQIIVAHWVVPTGIIGFFVSIILKKPLVTTIHGSDLNFYIEKSRLAFWLARLILKKSNLIITVSSDLKEKITKKFLIKREKIKVIPIGIDLDLFSPQPKNQARQTLKLPKKPKILLFAGGLTKVKGFEVLRKALPEVLKSIPDVVSLVLGKSEPDKLKAIKKRVKKEGLGKNLIFVGEVPPKKMPLWLNAADLVVIPSLSEGLGLIAIEALSCNTPVIASATGELTKIIKKTSGGLLFKPGVSADLSQKIIQLLKERKNKLKINRQFLKKNYDLKVNAKKFSNSLKSLFSDSNLYNTDYYSHLKEEFESLTCWAKDRIKNVITLAGPIKKGQKVLDLGCGIGTFTIEFSKLGALATGVDSSREALKTARRLAALQGQTKAKFLLADATRLPIKKNQYDLVVCADFIEHLNQEDYLKLLAEARRVLKPEGKLLIYTPCPTHLFEILRKHNLFLKRDPTHIGLKKPEEIAETLKLKNFVIEKIYFTPSHLPFLQLIEKGGSFLPLIGKFFRRRTCILARKKD